MGYRVAVHLHLAEQVTVLTRIRLAACFHLNAVPTRAITHHERLPRSPADLVFEQAKADGVIVRRAAWDARGCLDDDVRYAPRQQVA